jgi:hypothetical protein
VNQIPLTSFINTDQDSSGQFKTAVTRLPRAKCASKNAFGVMVPKFRVHENPTALQTLQTVDLVRKPTFILQNWLRQTSTARLSYITEEMADIEVREAGRIIPGIWR